MATKIPTGNRFLVVPQITKEDARKQAEKAKKAAEKRAPVVEEEIRQRRNRWNDAAQRAQRAYNQRPLSSDPNIVTTWLNTINSPSQEPSGTLKKPSAPSRGVFSFKGQYGGAGTQARESLQSILPTPGNFAEYAQFAAKRDTTSDPTEMKFYEKYALPQESHHSYIEQGNLWMTDSEALTNWILGDAAVNGYFSSDAEYDAACARQKQYEDYMDRYLRGVTTFDPETGRARIEQQFTADAPLPPWIPSTGMNNRKWQYYVTYSHDVVQSAADTYNTVTQAQKDFKTTPYKSAFSTNRTEQDIDSFLDILVSSRSMDEFKQNTADYFKYYVINPIKSGHVLTAGANALWNMMDTMDIAGRGVRAFVAGDTVLGGLGETDTRMVTKGYSDSKGEGINLKKSKLKTSETKDSTFKGQNVYWANIEGHSQEEIERAQRLFMQNGGYELLLKKHPGEASKAVLGSEKMSMSEEELTKKLNEAFAKEGIKWQDIYTDLDENFFTKDRTIKDVKQGIENVKLAYSQPESAFNADTGSIGADIIIETALDPGLLLGGISKGISTGSVRSAADNAIESGFRTILRDSDQASELLKNKKVRAAVAQFVSSNEGKNIIFKDSKRFGEDVELLIHNLSRETDLLSTEAAKDTFRRTITAHLLGKNTNINSKIIESTSWARNVLDTKTFKAAYYMDKAIDGIDSAIVKSSFAAPWGLVKGIKGGKKFLLNNTSVGRYYFAKKLKQAAAASLVYDEVTKSVDVTKASDVLRQLQANQLDVRSGSAALISVARQYDNLSRDINALIPKYVSGELSVDDISKIISDSVRNITGGKYGRITDLTAEIANYDIRYARDVQNAFDNLVQAEDRLRSIIDNVTDGSNQYFSEKALTPSEIKKGTAAYGRSVSGVTERSISVHDFHSMLESDFRDLLRAYSNPFGEGVFYPKSLGNLLEPDESVTAFSLDYIKTQIDKAISNIEFVDTVDYKYRQTPTASVAQSLAKDRRIHELRRLRDTVNNLDVISLKDVEIVTTLHTDRMAMFQAFTDRPAIKNLFDKGYNDIIAPVMDTFLTKYADDADLASESLFKDLLRIRELKYGFDRTNSLRSELGSLRGLSDKKIHTVINGLGNNFGRPYGSLNDVVRSPGVLRKNLELTTRTQFGAPKVGIDGLTDMLRSVDSSSPSKYLEPYLKEFDDPVKGPELKAWFDSVTNGDPLDSASYVDKQVLASILMDPSLIDDYNRLALQENNAPIFFHISSSGLSSEINEITSVSYRKWIPIEYSDDSPLTLEKIKAAFEAHDSSGSFRRGLSDAEINAISENNLRHMADWKGMSSSQIRAEYKKLFGASDNNPLKSESQLLEEVCRFLNDVSISSDGLTSQVPHLVVHDLDGFNIPFFNNRVANLSHYAADDSKMLDYSRRLSSQIGDASLNTYTRLAEQFGDSTFTSEELDQVTNILFNYVSDINRYAGDNYNITDFSEYEEVFRRIVTSSNETVNNTESAVDDVFYEIKKSISESADSNDYSDLIADYRYAVTDISDLTLYPKQFVFSSSGEVDNAVYEALKATGRDTINVESRIYVKDILSFFNIDSDAGLNVSFDALNKMHNFSQYIIRNRDHAMASSALEFLTPYKSQFDAFIESVVSEAKLLGRSSAEFEFLGNLRVPDNAIESYLTAQKLYDDYVKYWLSNDQFTSFKRSSKDIDVLKSNLNKYSYELRSRAHSGGPSHYRVRDNELNFEFFVDNLDVEGVEYLDDFSKLAPHDELESYIDMLKDELYEAACDHLNNYHTKNMGDMVELFSSDFRLQNRSSDEFVKILEGANRPDIFKAAANADYTKTVYSYKEGVLQEGIELASKVSEANSKIRSEIRQLNMIDSYYRRVGLNTTTDKATGMLFSKTKALFDMLDNTGLTRRESFKTFIKEASDIYHAKIQRYAMDILKSDGVFDRSKLLSELTWNNLNHIVYNSHAYSKEEIDGLKSFVTDLQKKGDDFLTLYEDKSTGNIYIALNYNAQITSDGTNRFINNVEKIVKPSRDAVSFSTFDELKEVLDIEDIDDFREVYEQLLSCWDDTRVLSRGAINGTSGKVITRKQMEDYLTTLPTQLEDMLSPKSMLVADTTRELIYDPGFIRSEDSDMLVDFLDTLSRQADIAKEDAVLINEVFASNNSLKFGELSEHFSDDELMRYFSNNPDYVVVTLTPNSNTRTGLEVRQLKLDNAASLKVAREAPNTTILPYDMYYEIADIMNRTSQEGYYRKLLGKYLLTYKAFALVKPGTWLRNYIDATTKTAIDGGHDLTNVASIFPYQSKAVRDLGTYSQIIKADPSLLTKSNWDVIQKTFKTDMTFDDFQLLRGVMDSDRFKSADRYFLNKNMVNNGGRQVIAGENAGLRGLPEADIKTAFKKYLASESDLPLSQNEFLDIYLGRVKAADDVMEQFDDMMRRLSSNMHNAEASTIFDKTINNMFRPFGAVENLVRYSQTMYLMDQGLSQNQILKHIHATQFYTAPSWGAFNKLETIMPFITFRYNNFMYWMRMMDENPRFFRYFEDVYGTIAEDTIENMIDEGQEMDYESDAFFQGGSIPLGDDGVYLKLGNSFLSSINDFYGGPELLFGQYGALNPLLRETLRFSAYGLGLNSKEFFSSVDLDVSKDISVQNLIGLLPGGNLVTQVYKDLNKMPGTFDDNGPTVNTLWQVLSSLGVLGIRKNYSSGGKLDFDSWQEELAAQGKWYDANLGKIVPLSEKNEYGANDPNNSWDDVQAYMLVHKGKLWDANQHKFVTPDELSINLDPRTADVNFDFENDPEAWDKLQAWMKLKGKVYDYNQRKFVTPEQYISGGLNDPNITFKEKNQLIYEKFGLLWDANQNTYVTPDKYMRGGLNDFSQLEGKAFLQHWNEVKSLRRALYGEEYMYDPEKGKKAFVKVYEPSVVTVGDFFKNEEYDDYFSRLGIPRLQNEDVKFHVSRDGFLVTDDGRYILTRNNEYNARVFDNFKYSSGGYNRSPHRYSKFKKQVYQAFRANKSPYKGRTLPSHYYTGYGWNDAEGYYRFNFQYNYQYHNPQPAAKLNRLLSPRINYPYGGGYNKYSFYTR